MEASLQHIFQHSFDDYQGKHRLPLKYHRAAQAIMSCRTPAQGGHELYCADLHERSIQYHSCRHRSCPRCNQQPKAEWVTRQLNRLLPVEHYHLIFTVPHELLPWWRFNQRWFNATLFKTVKETLMALAYDEKHLGAQPGFILELHAWERNLSLHPHIHCLMTGGGWDEIEATWKGSKEGYLL